MTPINISHVYCILNIFTNKRYVGSTIRLASRKRQHLHELRKNKHVCKIMQDEFNTYGESSFRFITLEEVKTFERDDLFIREQYWIDLYKPEYNNLSVAGKYIGDYIRTKEAKEKRRKNMLGRKPSAETRAKMSASHRANPRRGYKLTNEQKEHLSKINMGENNPNWGIGRSEETRKKISDGNARKTRAGFVDPNGVEYKLVKNLGWFCRERQLNYHCMSDLDSGRIKSYKGWTKIKVNDVS